MPFSWVLADAGYGRDPQLRVWCDGRKVPYVFGVPVGLPIDGSPGKPRQPAVKRADDLLHYAKVRDQVGSPLLRRRQGRASLRLDGLRRDREGRGPGRRLHALAGTAAVCAPQPGRQGRPAPPRDRLLPRPRPRRQHGLGCHCPGGRPLADRGGQRDQQAACHLAQYQVRKWAPVSVTSPPACCPPRSSASSAPPSPNPARPSNPSWIPAGSRRPIREKRRAPTRARPLADPRPALAAFGPYHPALPGRHPPQPPPSRRDRPDLRVMAPPPPDPRHGQPLPTPRRPATGPPPN